MAGWQLFRTFRTSKSKFAMKISLNWLKSYIETSLPAEEIAKILTDIGLEVEGLEQIETVRGGLSGLVVGEVLTCEKHPDADKLHVTTVDLGDGAPTQIVCGAPNVAAGQKVPLSYVADIRSVTGPNTINRENVQRKIVISANVSERDLRSVVNEIQDRVEANIRLPEGYHIEYGGQFESEAAASRTLLLTSLMSLLVIFMLLYNEFKDVKEINKNLGIYS